MSELRCTDSTDSWRHRGRCAHRSAPQRACACHHGARGQHAEMKRRGVKFQDYKMLVAHAGCRRGSDVPNRRTQLLHNQMQTCGPLRGVTGDGCTWSHARSGGRAAEQRAARQTLPSSIQRTQSSPAMHLAKRQPSMQARSANGPHVNCVAVPAAGESRQHGVCASCTAANRRMELTLKLAFCKRWFAHVCRQQSVQQ